MSKNNIEEYEDESSEEEYEEESSEEEYEEEEMKNSNEKIENRTHKKELSDFFNRIEKKFSDIDNQKNKTPTEIFEEVLEELKKGKK